MFTKVYPNLFTQRDPLFKEPIKLPMTNHKSTIHKYLLPTEIDYLFKSNYSCLLVFNRSLVHRYCETQITQVYKNNVSLRPILFNHKSPDTHNATDCFTIKWRRKKLGTGSLFGLNERRPEVRVQFPVGSNFSGSELVFRCAFSLVSREDN